MTKSQKIKALEADNADLLHGLKGCYQICIARGEVIGLDNRGPVMDGTRNLIKKYDGQKKGATK